MYLRVPDIVTSPFGPGRHRDGSGHLLLPSMLPTIVSLSKMEPPSMNWFVDIVKVLLVRSTVWRGKKGNTIERKQFPLMPAYAFTDFKSQGQTIESVIVDLAKPPSGGLTGFNVYVALSRSRGRETIRLLRDFDEKLFTVHPNEQLRREDQRLEALEKKTQECFEAGEFRLLDTPNTGSCVPNFFTYL
jgi:hypothetical protein